MEDDKIESKNDFEFGIFPKRSDYGSKCSFTSFLINARLVF